MNIPPFELERYFAKHEFNVRHLLCASDCESLTVKDLFDFEPRSRMGFEKVWLGYTESLGHPELRAEIAGLYDSIAAKDVLVHAGAEEAIFNFMHSLLSPGDHVVVHWPCYQSLFQVAESIGCTITKWEANEANDWELDIDHLKRAIKPGTKAVVLNCPHNPTGYLMGNSHFRELVTLLDRLGIILFMDEVYKGLEYDGVEPLSSACDVSGLAVSLGVLSKAYGLAGLRLGWIATKNKTVYSKMAAFKDYTTICNSAPSEYLGTLALRQKERILRRNKDLINSNLLLLDSFFKRRNALLQWVRPKAGCIAFPKLTGLQNTDSFCGTLLETSGVLLAPSSKFGYGQSNFRLGYGRSSLPKALEAFDFFLTEKGALV